MLKWCVFVCSPNVENACNSVREIIKTPCRDFSLSILFVRGIAWREKIALIRLVLCYPFFLCERGSYFCFLYDFKYNWINWLFCCQPFLRNLLFVSKTIFLLSLSSTAQTESIDCTNYNSLLWSTVAISTSTNTALPMCITIQLPSCSGTEENPKVDKCIVGLLWWLEVPLRKRICWWCCLDIVDVAVHALVRRLCWKWCIQTTAIYGLYQLMTSQWKISAPLRIYFCLRRWRCVVVLMRI